MNVDKAMERTLLAAVARAADEIMAVARATVEVREKGDRSPVTQADERAEAVLLACLAEQAPGIPAVAEERVARDGLPEGVGQRFWLVDPLDGTREFLRGGTDFTVNIALVEDGEPVFGIVQCPADGRVFIGARDAGARMATLDGTGRLRDERAIRTRRPCATPPTIVASRSHGNAATDAWLANYPDATCISIGSSLKFCLLASGEADLYPRLGPTMEWDTAAGHAVLAAAGGHVTDATGAPFRYGKPDFRNGIFLAKGDPDCKTAALAGG